MKILILISKFVFSSHFRGGTYFVSPEVENIKIGFSHTWRRKQSGYSRGCQQSHVINQNYSKRFSGYSCSLTTSGNSCGNGDMTYMVTFVEDKVRVFNLKFYF